MFCPQCHCEYRPGFERCANCDVALVADLAEVEEHDRKPTRPRVAPGRMADFCGFLGLDEAREARDKLRAAGIDSEIAVREAPDSDPEGPVEEEYWLRFSPADARQATAILGFEEGAE